MPFVGTEPPPKCKPYFPPRMRMPVSDRTHTPVGVTRAPSPPPLFPCLALGSVNHTTMASQSLTSFRQKKGPCVNRQVASRRNQSRNGEGGREGERKRERESLFTKGKPLAMAMVVALVERQLGERPPRPLSIFVNYSGCHTTHRPCSNASEPH
ncbi:hypothetical protein LX32DRAFT_25 [Colletotrichum zoysiae]|uniref:Uncharacterized protein n=1 Tax=Colletotrichum zoysiae TaxID=1216348 RepID=A0AAD9HU93_9PEZI|nr:hypothetical protein LX32DRAFT_25 [Colletotrichum zoysiae]